MRTCSPGRPLFVLLASWACVGAAFAQAPTVTYVEGKSTIVSGSRALSPAAGVKIGQCDIVRNGPQAVVQIELDDGSKAVLGQDSRLVFDLPHVGDAAVGPNFLISGWVKITVPRRDKAPPYRINTPVFDLAIDAGVVVLRADARIGQFFVEQGEVLVTTASGSASKGVAVRAGSTYSRNSPSEDGSVVNRTDQAFVEAMPRALRDTLPSMLARVKGRDVQALPAPDFKSAEVEQWLKSHAQLRSCIVDVTVRNAQEALANKGLNVGAIDGLLGPRTQAALRVFQQRQGLKGSGQLDAETLRALEVVDRR